MAVWSLALIPITKSLPDESNVPSPATLSGKLPAVSSTPSIYNLTFADLSIVTNIWCFSPSFIVIAPVGVLEVALSSVSNRIVPACSRLIYQRLPPPPVAPLPILDFSATSPVSKSIST